MVGEVAEHHRQAETQASRLGDLSRTVVVRRPRVAEVFRTRGCPSDQSGDAGGRKPEFRRQRDRSIGQRDGLHGTLLRHLVPGGLAERRDQILPWWLRLQHRDRTKAKDAAPVDLAAPEANDGSHREGTTEGNAVIGRFRIGDRLIE